MNNLLKNYLPLVDFLGEVLGPDTEVVLHDVKDIEHSVVAIHNGQISGRTIGSPATNVVLKVIQDGSCNTLDYLANYMGVSITGRRLRSSTYFIHDELHQLIGILCINIDTSKLEYIQEYFENLTMMKSDPNAVESVEQFSTSVEELANESIKAAIRKAGASPQRMSQDEKLAVVERLDENGIFLLKGAISRVAAELDTSEATIYRYLTSIRKRTKRL